jgi:Mrp family chromosome partitioning ATPase/capsular polysaccharide biosynthesis protein
VAQNDELRGRSLREYVRLVWVRAWLVLAVAVLCAVTAFFVADAQTRMYEASARLMYQPPTDVTDPTSGSYSIDSSTLSIQLQSVIDTIEDPAVQKRAERLMGGRALSPDIELTAGVFVPENAEGDSSNLVEITARAPTPVAAAKTANACAAAVIDVRRSWEKQRYRAAQRVVKDQLKLFTTPSSKLTADYINLVQQLRNLQIAEATATGDFRIVVPATRPDAPVSPKPLQSAALGLGVGLVAGIGLAFISAKLDTRVRTYREAARIVDMPVIGRVPRMSRDALRGSTLVALSAPDGNVSEALRMLRSNLEWAGIDHGLRTVLVTSCVKGEGKTLTTCNLAVTLARAGKRVIVIDADLRDPRVHTMFNLPNAVGLTSVVLGKVELREALLVFQPSRAMHSKSDGPYPKSRSAAAGTCDPSDGSVLVLTSGPLPPDPGEVVASRRMSAVIAEAADSKADYVLIDAPPVLSVGDAGAMAASVDGLLLVANLNKVRRPTLVDGREYLEALPCRKIGMVVVGETIEQKQYYRYAKND